MKIDGVIQRKLALLDDQVMRLRLHMQGISLDRFEQDWVLRSMAERALQVAIEILIDVAERLICICGAGPAATAADAIAKCVQLGILPAEDRYKGLSGTATSLLPMNTNI
ncbi:MAG: DUF86 domain-containing protein [Sedimentisphaerales bacterium]|jgi:uncharacterized protein YutE (UPF0331/DUF86 family)|nr:DUF86 domain-containing protein [Sedimentisphaerales bacterium]